MKRRKQTSLPLDRLGFVGLSLGAIRQWRILLVASVGLALLSLMAWQRIPRLEEPQLESPEIFITLPYPGASAEDVETQAVKPVEEELYGLDGVEFIESKSYPNYAQIRMRFSYDTSMETMTERVRGKVLGKRKDLPAEVQDPIVNRVKLSTYLANMVVVVTGHRGDGVLTDTAKDLKDTLGGIPGVATVKLRGDRARAVRVRLDPVRLATHELSVEQVIRKIKQANVRIPGGEVPVGAVVTLLSVNNEMKDATSVGKIPIGASKDATGGTHAIALGDVAEVRDDFRTAEERMVQDGAPAVGLEVRFRPDENAVVVGERIRAAVDEARKRMPPGVGLDIAYDQPEWVKKTLHNFVESLVEGVLLVMLILTLGMGWRAGLVVAFVLPLAIGGAVLGLYVCGFALEQVSLAGLIVAIGLLVDDAVVVTESAQLMRDRGLSSLRAAVLGTARVFWANNGTTAVACASFLPLFVMGGDVGHFIRGLPVAVVIALVTSLFVAQLLTPWIATFLLKPHTNAQPISDLTPFDRNEDSAGTHADERNPVLRSIKATYTKLVPTIVDHPFRIIVVSVALLIGSCMLLPKVGIQFFPKADKPVLFLGVQLPRGTDMAGTTAKVLEVTGALAKDPAVQSTSVVVGGPYPTVFLGHARHAKSKDFADILVRLTSKSTDETVRRVRAELAAIPGVKTTVDELYNGPPVPHPITVRVQGEDRAKLQAYAEQVKTAVHAIPGTLNVTDSMSETVPVADVEIDADRALRLGLTPGEIGATLRAVYGEDKVGSFRQEGDTVEIVIEGPNTAKPLEGVAETLVPLAKGGRVPLLALGQVKVERSFAELRRRDTRQIVEVTADVEGGTLPSSILKKLEPQLAQMKWEHGFGYSFGGEKAETEKSFKTLGGAAGITLLLIFVLLVLMFGSLVRAAVVLAAVPFAMIGAITGLYVTHNAFGFMAFLGLVALIGVYVNHKIYFVDRMQELIRRGVSWQAALHQAGIDRLRPVVLTAFTAILGLLPLTLDGGAFWSAFGWVNIFGLATSIPLSLVLLPALLSVTYRFRKEQMWESTVVMGGGQQINPDAPTNVVPLRASDRRR